MVWYCLEEGKVISGFVSDWSEGSSTLFNVTTLWQTDAKKMDRGWWQDISGIKGLGGGCHIRCHAGASRQKSATVWEAVT